MSQEVYITYTYVYMHVYNIIRDHVYVIRTLYIHHFLQNKKLAVKKI